MAGGTGEDCPLPDMWALGVICYILLSGFSPFMGDSDTETYNNISSVTYDYECEEFDDISENAKVRPPCILVATNLTFSGLNNFSLDNPD